MMKNNNKYNTNEEENKQQINQKILPNKTSSSSSCSTNSLLKDSIRVNSKSRLLNVRGYLVNENKTITVNNNSKDVIHNSPEKMNSKGKILSSMERKLQELARRTAIRTTRSVDDSSEPSRSVRNNEKVSNGKREGYKVSKYSNIRRKNEDREGKFDSSQPITSRQELKKRLKLSNDKEKVMSKTTTSVQYTNHLELKRTEYEVYRRRDVDNSEEGVDRFVKFVDTSQAISSKQKLKSKLGLLNEEDEVSITSQGFSGKPLHESIDSIDQSSGITSGNIVNKSKILSLTTKINKNNYKRTNALSNNNNNNEAPVNPFHSKSVPSDATDVLRSSSPPVNTTAECPKQDEVLQNLEIEKEPSAIMTNDFVDNIESSFSITTTHKRSKAEEAIGDREATKSSSFTAVQNNKVRPGQVSNNFVRTNLKKRGLYRQKGGKNKAKRLLKERALELRNANEGSFNDNSNEKITGEDDNGNTPSRQDVARNTNDNTGGMSAIGLDPLQLTLDALKKRTKSSNTLNKTQIGQVNAIENELFLNKLKDKFGKRYTPARGTVARGLSSTKMKKSHGGSAPDYHKEYVAASEAAPPLCPGHHMPASLFTVKKAGDNKGRKFFSCSYPREQRCKFFLWVEDNPNLVSVISSKQNDLRKLDATTTESESPLECWLRFALENYKCKLEELDVLELKDEIALYNRRIVLARKYGYDAYLHMMSDQLTFTGRRDILMDRILKSAFMQLCSTCGLFLRNDDAVVNSATEKQDGLARSKRKYLSVSDDDDEDYDDHIDFDDDNDDSDSSISDLSVHDDGDDVAGHIGNRDSVSKTDINSSSEQRNGSTVSNMMELSSESDASVDDESDNESDNVSVATASSFGNDELLCDDETNFVPDRDLSASAEQAPLVANNEIQETLRCTFGHDRLREGQLWTVQRVLSRERSLLVLPTGAGKSLTYLLPTVLLNKLSFHFATNSASTAFAKGKLTLVVSPLVSLMQVQNAFLFTTGFDAYPNF